MKYSYKQAMEIIRFDMYQQIVDSQEIFELGIKTKWQSYVEKAKGSNIDPADMFSNEAEALNKMLYDHKLMNICLLCEFWEQDLYDFMNENNFYTVPDNSFKPLIAAFQVSFKTLGYDDPANFHTIKEMRKLTNAIKHGVGKSLNEVISLTNGKILADSNIGKIDENGNAINKKEIEFDCNTLTSRTLNVDGKLEQYQTAIVDFWEKVYQELKNIKSKNNSSSEIE